MAATTERLPQSCQACRTLQMPPAGRQAKGWTGKRKSRRCQCLAANWLPVCVRSWKCRPGMSIDATARGQADILLKAGRRIVGPLDGQRGEIRSRHIPAH